jgi:hypothetical protein
MSQFIDNQAEASDEEDDENKSEEMDSDDMNFINDVPEDELVRAESQHSPPPPSSAPPASPPPASLSPPATPPGSPSMDIDSQQSQPNMQASNLEEHIRSWVIDDDDLSLYNTFASNYALPTFDVNEYGISDREKILDVWKKLLTPRFTRAKEAIICCLIDKEGEISDIYTDTGQVPVLDEQTVHQVFVKYRNDCDQMIEALRGGDYDIFDTDYQNGTPVC